MLDPAAPATPARLLLVDPDEAVAGPLAADLDTLGYRVVRATDARGATVAMSEQPFDLILLERLLPGSDGIALLRWMRSERVRTPVIVLTALGRSEERVDGLESGADDYVVKPHDLPELNARIRALLRRAAAPRDEGDRATLSAGDITVSLLGHRAFRGGHAIDLHNTELRLLTELVRARGDAVTREALLERVWGTETPATNIVEAYVRRLRMKLEVRGLPDPIITLRGVGYKLRI